jgi:hypothetical protein
VLSPVVYAPAPCREDLRVQAGVKNAVDRRADVPEQPGVPVSEYCVARDVREVGLAGRCPALFVFSGTPPAIWLLKL